MIFLELKEGVADDLPNSIESRIAKISLQKLQHRRDLISLAMSS